MRILTETVFNRNIVLAFARRLRIPIIDARPFGSSYSMKGKEFPHWNGYQLEIKPSTQTSEILHDVCHWIVTSIEDKSKEDFGLPLMKKEEADKVEDEVGFLENTLLDLLSCASEELEVVWKEAQRD